MRNNKCKGPKVGRCLTCGLGVTVPNRVVHVAEEQRERGQGPWASQLR